MNLYSKFFITLICVWFIFSVSYTQISVIDNKGTLNAVDTSKWTVLNGSLFSKGNLNVGIGVNNPQAKLHTFGSIRFAGLSTSNSNSDLLTTDINGNLASRTFASLISGNAITSLNGLTGSSQTFNTGTSGTDFNLSSSGTVHNFNLPTASASNRGALSASDWTLFNNKQNNIVVGTTSQYWRGDKTWQTLNTTVVIEGSNLYFTNTRARAALSLTTSGTSGAATYNSSNGVLNIPNYNSGTFTLNGLIPTSQTLNTGASGTDFNINSNGSSHVFNLPSASATNRGLLNTGDWINFNNKISAINASAPLATTISGSNVNLQLNTSSIVAGLSNSSSNIPLTLDANANNSIVSTNNVAFNINNTAPLWNANQLRGRNLSTTTPTNGQILKWDGNNWAPSDEAATVNWLRTGNNNATYGTHFLGNTNDVPMTLRSNNTSMLEVGRRETLGLWDATSTGLYPYDQQNGSVMYIRGTGGNSALQFESSSSAFYKPIFFTDSDGNFMMRGSCARTDFFEFGGAGALNDGKIYFTVGDDGEEPLIFRKYNYTPAGYVEMLRLQGTGLNNTVRVGVNTGGVIANSTFQVVGSVTNSIVSTNSALTLTEEHHTVIVTANVNIALPAANTCLGRVYIVKKTHNSSSQITSYINTSGGNSTTLARGVYRLQSDGTSWQQL